MSRRRPPLIPRSPLLVLSVPAVIGIWFASAVEPTLVYAISGILLVCSIIGVALRRWPNAATLVAVFGGFAIVHTLSINHRESAPRWAAVEAGARPILEVTGKVRNITPATRGSNFSWNYQLTSDSIKASDGKHWNGNWKFLLTCQRPDLGFGDRIQVRTNAVLPAQNRNPGGFDRRKWILRQGLSYQIIALDDPVIITPSEPWNPGIIVTRLREWLDQSVTQGLDAHPDVCAILRAITLGDRRGLTQEQEDTFQFSGTMHLFAVSGLHVAMVAGLLIGLAKLLRLPPWLAVPFFIIGIVLYTAATGLRPSATRALVMIILYGAALIWERSPTLLNTLGAAALILLGINTWEIFSIGFQLSFLVMLGIGIAGRWFRDRFREKVEPDPFIPKTLLTNKQHLGWKTRRTVADTIAISLGAWVGSVLPVIYYFNLVTPIVVIANLFLIFPAFAILWVSSLSVLFSALGLTWFAVTANHANLVLVKCVTAIAGVFASVPGGHFFVPEHQLFPPPGQLAEVTVFNVSSGGGAQLLRFGQDHHWMIDAGDQRSINQIIRPALRDRGISQIDALLLSHGDSRHIAGAEDLAAMTPDLPIWIHPVPSRSPVEKTTRELAVSTKGYAAGDLFEPDGNSLIEVLFPPRSWVPNLADDGCGIFRVTVGKARLLFVSDTGFSAERYLTINNIDIGADILIMGRHASDFSGTGDFISAVDPKVIIATNAPFPEGQKIPSRWKESLEKKQIKLFDQRQTGAVTIRLFRDRVEFHSALNLEEFELQLSQNP